MLACVRVAETLDYFEAITALVYRNHGVLDVVRPRRTV